MGSNGFARRVFVVLGASALSMMLVVVAGYVEARLTSVGAVAAELAHRQREGQVAPNGEELFRTLREAQLRSRFIYRPVVALCVGATVGALVARKRRVLISAAMLPFLILVWDHERWDLKGIAFVALYLALSILGGELAGMLKSRQPRVTAGSEAHSK